MEVNSIGKELIRGKKLLKEGSIRSWALDAELLLMHVTGLTRVALLTKESRLVNSQDSAAYRRLLDRRLAREPVQYIINKAEFMGLDFYVDKNVLIPRPDTECLCELAAAFINANGCKSLLDVCTGSGCIAVSLGVLCSGLEEITASDISGGALKIAEKNAQAHGFENKISVVESDMFDKISGCFDVIASNPPYIPHGVVASLEANVRDYEPGGALLGGEDGLDFYRIIAAQAKARLNPGGRIFMEIGWDQKDAVKQLFLAEGYRFELEGKDLSGLDRNLVFSKSKD